MTIAWQRSEAEAFQTCKRRGFWAYLYNQRGIDRRAVSVPLLTGSLIHEPLAGMLNSAKMRPQASREEFSELADAVVFEARRNYLDVVKTRGILLDAFDGDPEKPGVIERNPMSWQVNEQLALLEALVKGWTRVRLPLLLAEYDIVDVEQEQDFDVAPGIRMMTRRDAMLRRKASGEHFVLNFKTVANPDSTWRESFRYDIQTISEFIAADRSLEGQASLRGVLIEGLVKGSRSFVWPDGSDQRRHNSPLLYHWCTPDAPPMGRSYALSAYYQCKAPHPHRWAKGGQCPGFKNHKLSDDYQRNMVSQTCGINDWLDWMEEHEPDELKGQFINLPAVLRSEFDIARWKRQTESAAGDVAGRLNRFGQTGADEMALDYWFPMETAAQNCLKPSRCPYLDLCFGMADPDDTELFVPREFNHPQEARLIQIAVAS